MSVLLLRRRSAILLYPLVGWALCGATMGVGLATMSVARAAVVHAIAAPVIFATISWSYFRRFRQAAPLQTAMVFLSVVIAMDFFVAALLIQRSLAMFSSALGTWIPFALIFVSTYGAGWYRKHQTRCRR